MLTAFIHTSPRSASHTTLQTLTDDVKYNKSMLQVFILPKMYFFRPSWQVKDQDKSQITSMHNKLNAWNVVKKFGLGTMLRRISDTATHVTNSWTQVSRSLIGQQQQCIISSVRSPCFPSHRK